MFTVTPEMLEVMAKTASSLIEAPFYKVAQVQLGVADLSDATVFEKIGTDFFLAEQEWTDIADGLEAAEELCR